MDNGGVRSYARSTRHDPRRSTFPEHPRIPSVAPAFVELLKREIEGKGRESMRGRDNERESGKISGRAALLLAVILCRTKQGVNVKLVVGENVSTSHPLYSRKNSTHEARSPLDIYTSLARYTSFQRN